MRLAREAIRQRGDFVGAHRVLTAAAGMAGQATMSPLPRCRSFAARSPIFRSPGSPSQMPIKQDSDREHYLEGFRRAGLK